MKRVELLTIEDTFQMEGFGVLVLPNFSVPGGKWQEQIAAVLVERPDGSELEAVARFGISHFKISDSTASLDARWRVVISFADKNKDDLPIGSKIFVREEIRNALIPKTAS